MYKLMKSLITEYGMKWTVNRSLYSGKLKMLSKMKFSESFFEKDINIARIDLFDLDIERLESFLLSLPSEQKKEICLSADKAIEGKIKAFSSIELDYGNPINWHYNPLTEKESEKNIKWYDIPDFSQKFGDIKVIWEASRLTFFYDYIRAYLITKDEKYYRAFSAQLNDWLIENKYSYGANFKCGQECTLRMINALVAHSFFSKMELVTKTDDYNVAKLANDCYKKVLSNFFYAHKCIKNNHTFTEICGLIIGAWCTENNSGLVRAYDLLEQEINKQFESDGGFKQYSFNYQRFTLQIIECVFKISEKTKINIKNTKIIKKSILLLHQLTNSSGYIPNYGSNDGALIFPVTSCDYRDFRPIINTIYYLIEGKSLLKPDLYDEEIIWFSKTKPSETEIIEKKSKAYHESGFYKIQHEDGYVMTTLQSYNSRPAHMDQNHMDVWHKGVNVICDLGTYSYASELGSYLASTSAHNTVQIDNVEQMNKVGAFLVTNWSKREDVQFNESYYKGTMISQNNYEHQREIFKNKNIYTLKDYVFGDGKVVKLYFHTPCKITQHQNTLTLSYNGKKICEIIIEKNLDIFISKKYRSLYYLKKEDINCITVSKKIVNKKTEINTKLQLY